MIRPILEQLGLPDSHQFIAGAAAFAAALSINPGRLNDRPIPNTNQGPLPTLTADAQPASGGDISEPEIANDNTSRLGEAQEKQIERRVPHIVQRYIDRNVVVINALRCSGSLVRQEGVLFAAHCIDEGDFKEINPLYEGADHQEYMVSPRPVIVESGIDSADLRFVSKVAEFAVASRLDRNGNVSIDQALAVFPGANPKQVIQAARSEELPRGAIDNLDPNKTTIYVAGDPYPTQYGGVDSMGNMLRQELATTYIGEDTNEGVDGPTDINNVLSATVKRNNNGAICSWGLSGARGLVESIKRLPGHHFKKVIRSIGVFSAFASFTALRELGGSKQARTQAEANGSKKYTRQNFPQANLKGVAGVCDYAPDMINPSAYKVVRIVQSTAEIPQPATQLP